MAKKGGGGEPDELEVLKGTLLARELEVFTIKDKMHRLEDRSQLMEQTMEHLSASLGEKISMLTDINNYLKRLKDQLQREQRDHAEAISDVERVSVQEKERLKKEIQIRVEETRKEMTKLIEEQLHSKTKRTITDNEQLKKEVAYHTYQTDILLQQNEKLIQEAGEHVRSLHLAKELEEELARRNHIYQKTTRILVFKLQELQDGRKEQTEKEKKDSEELQELLKRAEQLKTPPQPEHQRGSITAKGRACEDAIKFLYACLEDIELERIAHTPVQNLVLSSESTPVLQPDTLDQFSLKQRHHLLVKLLHQAVSLKSFMDQMGSHSRRSGYISGGRSPKGKVPKIQVSDILELPIEKLLGEAGEIRQDP
ncbi:unnamed protein product [Sphagnum jensenii]|uniref:Uncharacterized protein n=2 Tax=Sphagnum jensenii TaxID=128206 RepID=A0ABP1ARX0_9BRYO